MARGTRKISLAGNGNGPAAAPEHNTPAGEISQEGAPDMATTDINQALGEQPENNDTQTAAVNLPGNGNGNNNSTQTDVDEDLVPPNVRQLTVAQKRKLYEKDIRAMGRDFNKAALTTLGLADKLLEGTCDDVFLIDKSRKIDDALEMYRAYRMPDKTSAKVDEDADTFKNNLAKYRNVVYLGMIYRDDAQEWFGHVRDLYEQAVADPGVKKTMKKFNGTFEGVLDIVREQLHRQGKDANAPLMDDGEIFQAMQAAGPKDEDAIQWLIEAFKKASMAYEGKPAKGEKKAVDGIKEPELQAIIQSMQDFANTQLSADQRQRFMSETGKKQRTRRNIKAPTPGQTAGKNGQTQPEPEDEQTEEEIAQAMANQE